MDPRLGTLEAAGDRWRLRFVRELPHPPEKVWRALTEPEHLVTWFPGRIEGEWRAGAPLRFVMEGPPATTFDGEVVAIDPPRLLEFDWGDDRLRFELEPTTSGTTVTMTDTFVEQGKAARDGAGWHVCLERLDRHLAGQPGSTDPTEGWNEVNARYVERFGPEAATIGPPEGHPVLDDRA